MALNSNHHPAATSKPETVSRKLRPWLTLAACVVGLLDGSMRGNAADDAQVRLGREAKEMAAEHGWIEGLHTVEWIRPDILSVRLDGGIVGVLGPTNKTAVAAIGGPATA